MRTEGIALARGTGTADTPLELAAGICSAIKQYSLEPSEPDRDTFFTVQLREGRFAQQGGV